MCRLDIATSDNIITLPVKELALFFQNFRLSVIAKKKKKKSASENIASTAENGNT